MNSIKRDTLWCDLRLCKTAFREATTADVIPNHVARYWDLMAL